MLIVVGNLIDYLTTRTALSRGARDMNRLIRAESLATVKGIGVLVQLVVVVFFVTEPYRLGTGVTIFVMFVAIGFWNRVHTPNG